MPFDLKKSLPKTGTRFALPTLYGSSDAYALSVAALELKALGFRTVEEIAAMNDLTIQKVSMGARQLKNNAVAYLDDAQAGALLASTTAENDKLNTLVAEQGRKLEEQGAMLNDLFAFFKR